DKFPQPKLSDCFQMLAYMLMSGAQQAYLVVVNTPQYKDYTDPDAMCEIWSLEREEQGYILLSEHNYYWQHERNNPETINEENLRREVQRHQSYMTGNGNVPPIALNSEDAWLCRSIVRKPTENSPGTMTPKCAY